MKPLLSLPEAAQRLNLSTRHVHRLIREDSTFPARRIGQNGHWKIDGNDLEEWIKSQPTWTDSRNAVVEITRPRRGRPPLSRTSPKRQVK